MPYLYRPRRLRVEKNPPSASSWTHLKEFDRISTDADEARALSLNDLKAILRRVPHSERGVEWTERVVVAYCLKRKKSGRVRSLKRDITKHWTALGQPEKSSDFVARLEAAFILMNQTGSPSFFLGFDFPSALPVAQELVAIIKSLEDHGQTVFLNSGTLLGAVREQSFLKHDDDIDLGIMLNATTHEAAARELVAIFNTLKAGLDFKVKSSFVSPVVKIRLTSDVVVDLFPTYFCDDRLYIWPHTFGELGKEDLNPFQTLKMDGHDMPAPAEAEKMLALNYGDEWRVPDAGFRFPWPEAREKFAGLLKVYWWEVRKNAVKNAIFRR